MIADILSEIKLRKIDVTIYFWPHIPGGWRVTLELKNNHGDKLKVERRNDDFEVAMISAYEAIRQGTIHPALPAPREPLDILDPPASDDDGIPF